MSDDRVDFASMLASRLCHDLLSPVGAFANGLELLADEKDPEMRARCIENARRKNLSLLAEVRALCSSSSMQRARISGSFSSASSSRFRVHAGLAAVP